MKTAINSFAMWLLSTSRAIKKETKLSYFLVANHKKQSWECPICNFKGPFRDLQPASGTRKHAKCPKCGSLERHRLQHLVFSDFMHKTDISGWKMLHFAPEPFFESIFREKVVQYETADLLRENVDHKVDLIDLPFKDNSYDLVYASHVLEHIKDDEKAIYEIYRILKPNGVAFLPVPLVSEKTIEYPEANPLEEFHVRAPGPDYFNKYQDAFSEVDIFSSTMYPQKFQTFVYEDRSHWPIPSCPLRPAMTGKKHIGIVPVCYAKK